MLLVSKKLCFDLIKNVFPINLTSIAFEVAVRLIGDSQSHHIIYLRDKTLFLVYSPLSSSLLGII